jgi:3-hydroxyisobutyrate dehydrogenase-like beta-hydroxyacid dehydrogenase
VEQVADGPDGLLAGARSGLLWLEMSTIDPEVTRRVADRAAEQQVTVLDAAIGGATAQVTEGALLFMVGGEPAEVDRARPVLGLLGEVVHCGPTGSGVSMKLVNNMLAGVTFVATCEALLLGRKAGLSVDTMRQVLSRTAANTMHLHRSIPSRVIPRNFEPGFRLDLMYKDAGLAMDLAHRLGAPQSLAALVQELRTAAMSRGLATHDTTVLVQILETLAGIQVNEETTEHPASLQPDDLPKQGKI